MRVSAFEWNQEAVEKLENHDLGPDDVEWLFAFGEPVFRRHACMAGRFFALGFVPDGRFALVVFEYNRRQQRVRVVTAYEPTEASWRIRYDAISKGKA